MLVVRMLDFNGGLSALNGVSLSVVSLSVNLKEWQYKDILDENDIQETA